MARIEQDSGHAIIISIPALSNAGCAARVGAGTVLTFFTGKARGLSVPKGLKISSKLSPPPTPRSSIVALFLIWAKHMARAMRWAMRLKVWNVMIVSLAAWRSDRKHQNQHTMSMGTK